MSFATDERDLVDRLVRRLPPKRYRSDRYQRWFPTTGALMIRSLRRYGAPPSPVRGDAGSVAVVVAPWLHTPVPWYSVMLALGIRRRGRPVVLVWDDTGFPERDTASQNRVIGDVLQVVPLPVLRLSDLEGAPPAPTDDEAVGSLARQNLHWALRGAPPTSADEALAAEMEAALHATLPLVRAALDQVQPEAIVAPGGVRGSSGLFLLAAAERGARGATFDVDRGVAQICVDGVAAQNADVPRAFAHVWTAGSHDRDVAIRVGQEEYRRRTAGSDRYGFQVIPAGAADDASASSSEATDALVLLNVDWDTAALGRHVHFADTRDWVTTTVREVLAEGDRTVVVRQHPSERRAGQRSRLDMAQVLRDAFPSDPRVRFVPADAPISTYDLLGPARVVLPFSSNVGIEAAALGKSVVVAGASHYSQLGFVWSASSRAEYQELLGRGLRGELPELPDQRDRAWAYFGLVAVENRVWTDFTPHPDDFWGWCRRAPDDVFETPEVADMLEALDRAVPVSLIRHTRRVAQDAA